MKKILLLISAICFTHIIVAQSLIRESIGSGGNIYNSKNIYLRTSIGQNSASVGSVKNNNITLRQGFQQPLLRIIKEESVIGELDLIIYPNPFKNHINIEFSEIQDEEIVIMIYDNRGKIIKKLNYNMLKEITIPFYSFARGSYFLNIISGEKQYNTTIIKQ
ncbi:T9SS type A sorting domain-containing protein [Flavobacteriales bacterium]|nr:T9SS type A sorting domain-containing protein [Flavobacteriales bacterium]